MKIIFLTVGKKGGITDDAVSEYVKRLQKYISVERVILPNSNKKKENETIAKHLSDEDFVVALDEKGKGLSTLELAKFLEGKMISGEKKIIFVIGGAYGLDESIIKRADMIWSLSKLTFPHEIAWIVLAESVYRAFTVIKGESYHHA
ncbi:MAG: 23S rRNA (pseudouridine(1915)-N(3))-methyltransferase RlmH [Candidatus Paceibacterota bacterium]|jgi:23S rRNA (pseudouridine1915-N3)-methyltransferase